MANIDVFEVGQSIDQYKVIRLIANTQNSHLYLVEASGLHKCIVLKLFSGQLTAPATKKFVDQANLLLEFQQHPHIVNVMHLGVIEQRPFMVMPYYPQTLNDLLAVHYQKLSFLTSLGIIKQVLLATQSLHHLGIVHLDIKPQNVYLDEANNTGLADFDNALVLEKSPLFGCFETTANTSYEDQVRNVRYTTAFASPEQVNNLTQSSALNESSDLYSIGALWFRMLVGDTLFNMTSKQSIIEVNASFIHMQLTDIAPQWVAQLISELLSISPLKRPSCDICLKRIDQHVQTPDSNQTLQANDIQISPTLSNIQNDIKQILLTEGWVSSAEKIRLLATHRILEIKASRNDAGPAQEQLQDSLQQVIDECEKQLIQDKNLSAWFGWVNYVQIVLEKSGPSIRSDQYLQMLQVGRAARPDKPIIADKLLKKYFQIDKSSSTLAKRYLLPILIIVLVIFYWLQTGQDDVTSAKQKPVFMTFTGKDITAENRPEDPVIENSQTIQNEAKDYLTLPNQEAIQRPNVIEDNLTLQKGTYEFALGTGNEVTKVTVDWVKLKQLPKLKIMSTEVTHSLYYFCIKEGACRQTKQYSTAPKRNLDNNEDHPKVNLSWYEITEQFIPWINQRTARTFSLPSLHQWQIFSQSAELSKATTAIAHCKDCAAPLARQFMGGTMPVKAISADSNGMYHVFGNAQEWLSNCWQEQSIDAQQVERCDQAMVAGGSWLNKKSDLHKPYLTQLLKTAKTPTTGFRLVELANE